MPRKRAGRRYKCRSCNRTFKSPSLVWAHQRRDHGAKAAARGNGALPTEPAQRRGSTRLPDVTTLPSSDLLALHTQVSNEVLRRMG